MNTPPAAVERPIVLQFLPMATVPLAQQIMLRQYPDRRRLSINGDPSAVDAFASLPGEERSAVRVVSGPVRFGIDSLLAEPAQYVTMLREPADTAAALYYHVLGAPSHYLHRLVSEERQSLEDLIETRPEFDNPMVRRLNPEPEHRLRVGQISRGMLETAKMNLAERYIFGLAERFDESMLLFHRALGWTDLSYGPGLGAPAPRVSANLPAAMIDRIRRLNALDAELYAFAANIFQDRLAAACPNLGEDLAEFRQCHRPRPDAIMVEGKPLEFKPPPPLPPGRDVVWIASYPRSGNTWLRLLLQAYAIGPIQHLHELGRMTLELDWWMLRARAQGLDGNWVYHAGRQVQRRFRRTEGFPGDLFIKSHFVLRPDHPLLERSRCAVLVVRNPRDVLLSGVNYTELTTGQPVDDERAYARRFIAAGGDPGWARHGYGSWEEHAASWSGADGFPVLTIRYEDLKAEPSREFRRVLEFIGAPVDAARVDAAVAQCEFQKLRNLEVASRATSPIASMRNSERFFFYKGQAGQSLAHLGEEIEREFGDRFAPGMARLGYA
jgi:hypothetical protein